MNKKKVKGFTLVELLAVIVILAVILVIAMPKINEVIKKTRLSSLEATTKMIINSAEKKYTENQVLEQGTNIGCSDVAKLNKNDYGTCKITFDDKGNASVILNGKKDGKFDNLTCSGTRGNITCKEGTIVASLKCNSGKSSLTQGDEYVNGQYTYRYKQTYNDFGEWSNSNLDGWSVRLTDKSSTDPVTTELCSTINDKPVYDMSNMFLGSQAISLDLSSFDTSKVTNMSGMFSGSQATSLDLSSFDTSKVTNMNSMFSESQATSLDLLSFNTINVTKMTYMFYGSAATSLDLSSFDTSNVTNMSNMFYNSQATSLDLSSFDTSKVTDMSDMFHDSQATSLDLSSFDTSNVISMDRMFASSKATSLDLSSFDTSKVTNMHAMFDSSKATSLNLISFNTSNVTDMFGMFQNSQATSLDLSSFDTSKVTKMGWMFNNSQARTGYAKTCEDAARFNATNNRPLTFTVKDTTC